MKSLFFSLIVLFFFIGCDDWKAKVESNTSWSGSFGGRTIDGSGSRTIDLEAEGGTVCCVVQKQTEKGSLKVSIINDSFLGIDGDSKTTTAAYGVVSVCN